ncbi:sulfate transporter N-terminal domain with GLY motif-domain-containing protein [Globomyces pollinis-pini]|nr:sulfate transporter N-terminal domain with GLY motif-domain-containing protein [Globomyces pollinis-pini]
MVQLSKYLPIVNWSRTYRGSYFWNDLVAGSTLAAIAIPQCMAYASLAYLPQERGLYSAIIASVVFLVFGSNPSMSVGPFAVVSLMIGNAALSNAFWLEGLIPPLVTSMDDDIWLLHPYLLPLTDLMTLMVGCLIAILLITKVGQYLKVLLPNELISGFTAAAAFSILTSQVKGILKLKLNPISGSCVLLKSWREISSKLLDTHMPSLAISLSTAAIIIILGKVEYYGTKLGSTDGIHPEQSILKLPKTLIAMVFMTVISAVFNLHQTFDIDVIGIIPTNIPDIHNPIKLLIELPSAIRHTLIAKVSFDIMAITLVLYVTNLSIIQTFPSLEGNPSEQTPLLTPERDATLIDFDQDDNRSEEDEEMMKRDSSDVEFHELLSLSLSNILCSCFSGYVCCGSLSRSALLGNQTQAKTTMANFICSLLIVITICLLTSFIYHVPIPTLSMVIVFAIKNTAMKVMEFFRLLKIYHIERKETALENVLIWTVTFLGVIILDPSVGILVGMSFCLLWRSFSICGTE